MSPQNRRRWPSLRGGWIITEPAWLAPGERAAQAEPTLAASIVDGWCADPAAWPILFDLYEEISGDRLRPPTSTDIEQHVRPRLRAELERGRLVLVEAAPSTRARREEKAVHVKGPPPPPRAREPGPKKLTRILTEDDLSFVEIALVDEAGEPVAGVAYEIELPGGDVRTGSLDGEGTLRIERIPMGTCKVTFPGLDKADFVG